MTLAQIGEEIGLATSSVGDLANGYSESPRGDAALKLHALHEAKCGALPAESTGVAA